MPFFTSLQLLAALVSAGATSVSAHSFVSNINIDGRSYQGFRPLPGYQNPPPPDGLTSYQSPDIICHRGGANGHGHAPVKAGGQIHVQWNGWPQNHRGPVLDYLADCGASGCETVDKTKLNFFKISQAGLVTPATKQKDGSGSGPPPSFGYWASDQLIANNNSWVVEIPPRIKPGFYVLRTEIIALHNASYSDGAQNYPQCFNLEVQGAGGTEVPVGTPGENLYRASDPGVQLNISTGVQNYPIPGPTLISDAVTASLSHPVPTASGTPITVDELARVTPAPGDSVIATTTQAVVANGVKGHSRDVGRRWYHQGQGF
ncbi:glycosyl hydrolase family 61-domain-containing protein [Apiospora rasikravindrae]|uniref:lytic cellulose monooxygenase (C4-dehydrogenating) n=1 Tax=Apiospora rasikravindrae TaxID=990691 RepID=A0ABR1TE24_9PEZI